jgi:hypothetical protein
VDGKARLDSEWLEQLVEFGHGVLRVGHRKAVPAAITPVSK